MIITKVNKFIELRLRATLKSIVVVLQVALRSSRLFQPRQRAQAPLTCQSAPPMDYDLQAVQRW